MRLEFRFSEEELKRRILTHVTVVRDPTGDGNLLQSK